MNWVLWAGIGVVLGLSQRQQEDISHPWLMVVHESVQVGRDVSSVRVIDKVVSVISVVWWRRRAHRRG